MENFEGQWLSNGRYFVKSHIGRGGMADVYLVWDKDRSVDLAMKVINSELAEDTSFLKRFHREANALAKLDHPSIVRFYGLIEDDQVTFILMDFIRGSSLSREIKTSHGPLTPSRILNVIGPICAALDYAHQSNVVHCDIKPGNILIDLSNRPFIADFGIARMLDAASTTMTMAGAGTPDYMSPEQIRGEKPAPTMDIYALGVLLFALVTGGKLPFIGDKAPINGSRQEKVRWEHQNLIPPSPDLLNPLVPKVLAEIILKCLNKDPAGRFSKPMELFDALKPVLEEMIAQNQALSSMPTPDYPLPIPDHALQEKAKEPIYQRIRHKSPGLIMAAVLLVAALSVALLMGIGSKKNLPTPQPGSTAALIPTTRILASSIQQPTSTIVVTDIPTVIIPTNTSVPSPMPAPVTSDLDWSQREILDSNNKPFAFASLVIDANDSAHIVYFIEKDTDVLRYQSNATGVWQTKTDLSSERGVFFDNLIIDPQGVLTLSHYAYINNPDKPKQLSYSKFSNPVWLSNSVLTSNTIMVDAAMALDSKGEPHFVYVNKPEHNLYYGSLNQGYQPFQYIDHADVVDPGKPIGKSVAIQMTPDDRPAIAYFSETEGLKYIEMQNGVWEPANNGRIVDSSPGAGGFPSLAFDHQGNPHIVYLSSNKSELKHAVRIAGQWLVESIDSANAGWYTSLAIDQNNHLHVSYMTSNLLTLKYTIGIFDSWHTVIVDQSQQVGRYTSIALDSKGLPHIAYCTDQVIYLTGKIK